jgi:hypothetical protein
MIRSLLCGRRRSQLRAAFVERTLPARLVDGLWHHLRSCAPCRRYYDQLIRLERLAGTRGTSDATPAPLELDLWTARVVASLEAQHRPRRILWLASAGAAAAAAAVWLISVWPVASPELTSRGPDEMQLAVRAFCQVSEPDGQGWVRSLSTKPGPMEVATCPSTGWVRFAYHSPVGGLLYVFVQLAGEPLEQLEGPAERGAWAVSAAGDLSPLEVALAPGFARGQKRATVYFIRSDEPRDPTELAAALANTDQPRDPTELAAALADTGAVDRADICIREIQFEGQLKPQESEP